MAENTNVENENEPSSPKQSHNRSLPVDPIITCPLDESHRMKMSKLQSHLERCLTGDLIEMPCPWNPRHIVDEASYNYHVCRCPDMPTGRNESDKQTTDSEN